MSYSGPSLGPGSGLPTTGAALSLSLSLSDANFSSTNILSDLDLGKFVVVKQIHKLVVQAHSKMY